MTYRVKLLAVALIAISTLHCSEITTPEKDSLARGAELLLPFKRDLKDALMSGLEEGAVKAIRVCKDEAPAIAHGLSVDGVTVGRTSHRLRNSANQAPAWVEEILHSYMNSDSERSPIATTLPNNLIGYAEPITVQPLCLVCHGQKIAPDVTARIKTYYPQDQATGFEAGDLRGIYWVEFIRNNANKR